MKRRACLTILFTAIAAAALAQRTDNSHPIAAPDEATAVKIAEKALAKVYGEKKIESERPFKAKLRDGIWHIWGTLYCKDQHGNVITDACVGGVAIAQVRQRDGKVLNITHEK
jgi:hypothetical protein